MYESDEREVKKMSLLEDNDYTVCYTDGTMFLVWDNTIEIYSILIVKDGLITSKTDFTSPASAKKEYLRRARL
jgi:hypothetical protein